MELADLVRDLDRTHNIISDLAERLHAFGDRDVATRFALDTVEDAADVLFDFRDRGEP
jgi:hypothetical protein